MPLPAVNATIARREEHRELVRDCRVVSLIAALVALGFLGAMHSLSMHDAVQFHGLSCTKIAGVGAVYFLALGAYAWYASARVDTRTEAGVMLARDRFKWSVVALFVPLLFWLVFEMASDGVLDGLGGGWGGKRKGRP